MAEAAKDNPKKKVDLGKILTIVFIILNVVITGGGAFLVFKSTLGWHAPVYTDEMATEKLQAEQKELEKLPLIFTMEKFKSNLDGLPIRAIEVEVNVEMMNRDGYEELIDSDNLVKVRDKVIHILQTKTFDDIETVQGKLFLKDQIARVLGEILIKGIVKDVFFSQFKVE